MLLRQAQRGANAGNTFNGCSAYPACKGARQLDFLKIFLVHLVFAL